MLKTYTCHCISNHILQTYPKANRNHATQCMSTLRTTEDVKKYVKNIKVTKIRDLSVSFSEFNKLEVQLAGQALHIMYPDSRDLRCNKLCRARSQLFGDARFIAQISKCCWTQCAEALTGSLKPVAFKDFRVCCANVSSTRIAPVLCGLGTNASLVKAVSDFGIWRRGKFACCSMRL